MANYEIGWEKFKFPDEDEDDEKDDYEEGTEFEEENAENFQLAQVFPQQINPFYQLKKYRLWTGHTNFKITQPIALIRDNLLGVETLDIITPYRFHMSVGLRFDEKEIKLNVTNTVIRFLKEHEKNKRHQQSN